MHPEYAAYAHHIASLLARDATLAKYTFHGVTIKHKPSGWYAGVHRFGSEPEARGFVDGAAAGIKKQQTTI